MRPESTVNPSDIGISRSLKMLAIIFGLEDKIVVLEEIFQANVLEREGKTLSEP